MNSNNNKNNGDTTNSNKTAATTTTTKQQNSSFKTACAATTTATPPTVTKQQVQQQQLKQQQRRINSSNNNSKVGVADIKLSDKERAAGIQCDQIWENFRHFYKILKSFWTFLEQLIEYLANLGTYSCKYLIFLGNFSLFQMAKY